MQITSTTLERRYLKNFMVWRSQINIDSFSEHDAVSRKTCENSRRVKSLKYFFEINDVNHFTSSISHKLLYNVHRRRNPLTGTPKVDQRGKHWKHYISVKLKYGSSKSQNLFLPLIHISRAKTNKKYIRVTS